MDSFAQYLSEYRHIKALLKGPSGSGKTYLAASISKLHKTLFIDVEGGLLSAFPVVSRSITVRLVKEQDPAAFFNKLGACLGEAMSGEYEAVVLDSISEVSGRMEDEYASKGDGKLELQDWFKMTERVKKFSRMLRDLPCHTIVTALTKPTGKEDASAIFEPCLPGQTAAIVPGFFDVVGLLRKGAAGNYLLATDGPSIYQVKDRTHALTGEEKIGKLDPELLWKKLGDKIKEIAATK